MNENSENASSAVEAERYFIPYTLELDESTGKLFGIITKRPTPDPINDDSDQIDFVEIDKEITKVSPYKVRMDLEARNFHHFFFPTNSVESFVRKIKNHEAGKYEIAERRDADIKITVSNDRLQARAQTSEAWGGKKLTKEQIKKAIEQAKLSEKTIDKDALKKLIKTSKAIDIVLASAIPAHNGQDARLEILVQSKIEKVRNVDSIDAIDQHEVFDYSVVEVGEPLVRKIPASTGIEGLNVIGKTIKPKKGRDVKMPNRASGAEASPDDKNLIISAIKGHPVVSNTQAKVDPVLTLRAVDLNSGNVDYDGTVIVTGNVRSGFDVKASGDIFVKGFVNKGHLESGGSIYISGGIQGDTSNEAHSSFLKARENIEIKFANQSKIQCGGELHVKEYLLNCTTHSLKKITIGEKSGRGAIIGGHTKSNWSIRAKVLGSDAYVPTEIILGSNSVAQKELEKFQNKKKQRRLEATKLESVLRRIRETDDPTSMGDITLDKARKIENTLKAINDMIEEYDQHIDELQDVVPDSDQLQVHVESTLYPNVTIIINDASLHLEKEHRQVTIEKLNSDIEIRPLNDKE